MSLERLWAGWRREYVTRAADDSGGSGEGGSGEDDASEDNCVFCRILSGDETDEQTYLVWRDGRAAAILNLYPYTSGHLLVMPVRHVADPEALEAAEGQALWSTVVSAVTALRAAYAPHGLNLGANLGRPAGAGIPAHFHLHCVPRWDGDTNFMTTVAETRVLPEALSESHARVRECWPGANG